VPDGKNETAFVLPKDAFPGNEAPVHFGGFPGVWEPGRPVAVSELGFQTVSAARDARKELAPELVEKQVATGSAPAPPRENHIPLEAAPEEAEQITDEALAPAEPVAGVEG
jgi:hypothetical protein